MGRYYQYLTWAPDGQHLAFVQVSLNQSGQEVSLLSALSDGKKPVNNFTSQNFEPFLPVLVTQQPDHRIPGKRCDDRRAGPVPGGRGGRQK